MNATHHPAPPLASLAQPLRDAADYLQQYGWSHHQLYASTDTATPAATLVGALAIVCYGRPNPKPYHYPYFAPDRDAHGYTSFIIANLILGDFIGIDEMTDSDGQAIEYTLTDWNNEDYQSGACVIATLRAAATDYDHGWPV